VTVKVNPASVTVASLLRLEVLAATTIVTVCCPLELIVLVAGPEPILRVNQAPVVLSPTVVEPVQVSPVVAYTVLLVVVAAATVSNVAVLLILLT
jgi:hypothetical protein